MAKRMTIDGYGQLELNQVAFRRDGRIEAQCALASAIDFVENGMVLAIDPAAREVKMPSGSDAFLALNYTTEHMYDERLGGALKNFKLDNGTFKPRLGYLSTGDKFTTNCIAVADGDAAGTKATEAEVKAAVATKKYGKASATGALELTATASGAIAQVVKETTMPDGSYALQFIAL